MGLGYAGAFWASHAGLAVGGGFLAAKGAVVGWGATTAASQWGASHLIALSGNNAAAVSAVLAGASQTTDFPLRGNHPKTKGG